MADLGNILLASLNPDMRKQAEQSLNTYSTHPGFLAHMLRLVLDSSQNRAVRLSGSVYIKNLAKLRWEEVSMFSNFWYLQIKHVQSGCTTTTRGRQSCS